MSGRRAKKKVTALSDFKLIGIDTDIFIYYLEENPEFGIASKKIIDSLNSGNLRGVTSILAVSEIISKKGLSKSVAKDLEATFFEIPNLTILEVSLKVAVEAGRIRREYSLRLPDAIQLATALQFKAQAFVTNDEKLKIFDELEIILLQKSH